MKKYYLSTLAMLAALGFLVTDKFKGHGLPDEFQHASQVRLANGCLVEAIVFNETYKAFMTFKKLPIDSVVLGLSFITESGKLGGHAVVIFKYDDGCFIYDPLLGSYPVKYDPSTEKLEVLLHQLHFKPKVNLTGIEIVAS